jgi:hypothetical protein
MDRDDWLDVTAIMVILLGFISVTCLFVYGIINLISQMSFYSVFP